MKKKQTATLTIIGMGLLIANLTVMQRTSLPDVVKGIWMGIAIGILALPLILKKMGKVSG